MKASEELDKYLEHKRLYGKSGVPASIVVTRSQYEELKRGRYLSADDKYSGFGGLEVKLVVGVEDRPFADD